MNSLSFLDGNHWFLFKIIASYFDCCLVKQEEAKWASIMHCEGKDGNSCQMNFSRPDFMLNSNWFGPSTECGKDHSILTDAIGTLLGEDFNSDCKQICDVAASSQGCSPGSQPWVW